MGLAETLEPMTTWAPARQRERLMSLRSEQADRANWWLGVIQYAASGATRPDTEDRRVWAVLAAVALEAASDTGDLAEPEVVTRLANLATALSRHGRPAEFHPVLRPDDVARRCLALAAMAPEEAGSTEWKGDVDAMRRLRKVRNVVHHAVRLADEVEDEQLGRELAAWREVLPKLP